MSNFTHCLSEDHRGMEFLCDFCNVLLEAPNIWYYRVNKDDKYPSHATCWKCFVSMEG